MNVPALETHDLSVSYRHQPVLYGVDVVVPPGRLVGIIGPNGAGKSTMLKAVMGVVKPSGGRVEIFGKPLEQSLRRVGYVPQRESVDWDFPVTVADVALMGTYGSLGWFKRPGKAERERARAALEKVGMTPFADRQIGELSGGQQQRVFLARALAQEADLYLMDEPFAGVDAATERAIVELLREMRDRGKTVLVVHHDLHTAERYFDMMMLLNLNLVAFGDTADVFTPELLDKTYGGRLTLLSQVADRAARGPRS
ncbi:metal ABC transporter ATP-binding protein [Luteolibacter ambystomatis]|uniref:Metal ABC transporter ATP-binding protein n=1 Tax=Luteolibacter ambystomatis TaxID=2824561 RepID=A0A975PGR3_9BACT|nr:metal ABC transporter ATP-binding protein [Luteolibacter ambystomatis]QUE52840.1 metal ABC transporter ATP-binding protein [Luteolibacter ambystomatis]